MCAKHLPEEGIFLKFMSLLLAKINKTFPRFRIGKKWSWAKIMINLKAFKQISHTLPYPHATEQGFAVYQDMLQFPSGHVSCFRYEYLLFSE